MPPNYLWLQPGCFFAAEDNLGLGLLTCMPLYEDEHLPLPINTSYRHSQNKMEEMVDMDAEDVEPVSDGEAGVGWAD